MKKRILAMLGALVLSVTLTGCSSGTPAAVAPTVAPATEATWMEDHSISVDFSRSPKGNVEKAKELLNAFEVTAPFDFTYGDRRFSENLQDWEKTIIPGSSTEVRYALKGSGLVISVVYTLFEDTGALEWAIRILNEGTENSLIIDDFNTLSINFPSKGHTKVFYSLGGNAKDNDFTPITKALKTGDTLFLTCTGGRSSSGIMPYFNLYTDRDAGFIAAIGWSGQWEADWEKTATTLSTRMGMTDSHFYVKPGENLMQPVMMLIPWEGEGINGHNALRSHMLQHHTPKEADGGLPLGPITFGEMGGSSAETHIDFQQAITNQKMGYDAYWIDAGWHGDESLAGTINYSDAWYQHAGYWDALKVLYPNGMEEVSQSARDKGLEFLLWFEPERVYRNSPIYQEHREWLLSFSGNPNDYLVNMGNPEARTWLTDYIASLLKKYGVGIYRQDFNIDPLVFWRQADDKDRMGVTEMKYIEGEYQFLAGLLEQIPGLLIDNCASGGRRLDFMAMSYSVSLFRSDYVCWPASATAEGNQVEIYGLNYWLPITGTASMGRTDAYNFRSVFGFAIQTPNTISQYRKQIPLIEEFKKAREYFYGSYYPIVPFVEDTNSWFAYQMHRDDLDSGFVCAFRKLKSDVTQMYLPLSGLDENATYRFTLSDPEEDVEGGHTFTITGKELMEKGLDMNLPWKKSSKLYFYEKISQ